MHFTEVISLSLVYCHDVDRIERCAHPLNLLQEPDQESGRSIEIT